MENLRRYIKIKTAELNDSRFSFESLFDVIHNQDDRIFAEFDDYGQTVEVSYSDFRIYCLRAASYLTERIAGVPGEYVGLYMENSLSWVATFWAILMSGKRPVLLNAKLPDSVNNNIIKLLNIGCIVMPEGLKTELLAETVVTVENTCGFCREYQSCEPISEPKWANEIALTTTATSLSYKICFYTGTDFTYQVQNAKGILACNKMIKKHYQGRLKHLTFLPFYHIFGLVATYFWFAVFGRTFVFLNDYSPNTILATVKKHNVTHLFAVPLLWNTIVREIKKEIAAYPEKDRKKIEKVFDFTIKLQTVLPKTGMKISRRLFREITSKTLGNSICFLITGGGYVSNETLKVINAVGYPLHNGYGATEIGITSLEMRENVKYRVQGSIGRPFDSVKYKIDDGRMLVRGLSTCSKIMDKDGNVYSVDHADWFDTRDCADADETGSYFLRGRSDDVILGENGEKINPDMLEQKILLTAAQDYCILGIDGVPSLVFRLSENANCLILKKTCKEIEKALGVLAADGFKTVRCFYTCDRITAKNAIKVSRKQLLSKIDDGSVKLCPFSDIAKIKEKDIGEVSSDIAEKIKAIISGILMKDASEIGLDDRFILDLGGTSLDYCTLLIELENEFGAGVVPEGLTTVRELTKSVTDCYERS